MKLCRLNGTELVAAKVAQVAWMGGMYPSSGKSFEHNFGYHDIGPSTQYTVDNFPSNVNPLSHFTTEACTVLPRAPGPHQNSLIRMLALQAAICC